MNCSKAIENMRMCLNNYVRLNKIESLIIGISGGIDSAVTAALAEPVCKELEIKLRGYSLPCQSNKDDEVDIAGMVGRAFCDPFTHDPIDKMIDGLANHLLKDYTADYDDKVRFGNIKARTRMVYLYDRARKYNGIVLSTDNYTELLLGFWTLHGDVGDFGMLQNIWKTDVYQIAEELRDMYRRNGDHEQDYALELAIKAVPTDGLGVSESDFDQLGAATYQEVDHILQEMLEGRYDENNPVVKRHMSSKYKRNNPVNLSLKEIEECTGLVY